MPDNRMGEPMDTPDQRQQSGRATQSVEDLTLPELFALLWRKPVTTMRNLRAAGRPLAVAADPPLTSPIVDVPAIEPPPAAEPLPPSAPVSDPTSRAETFISSAQRLRAVDLRGVINRERAQLLLYALAFAFALAGSGALRGTETIPQGPQSLNHGAPYMWLGFFLWLIADVLAKWEVLRDGWQRLSTRERQRWIARAALGLLALGGLHRLAQSMNAPRELSVGMAISALALLAAGGLLWLVIEFAFWRMARPRQERIDSSPITYREHLRPRIWREISFLRMGMALAAAGSSVYIWLNTSGNRIEPPVLVLWLFNAALWCLVFAPLRWNVFAWASDGIDAVRRISIRGKGWILVALALTLAVGASFRLERLEEMPGEMYSDLVINILDAYNIHHGVDQRIFLANNGGREPMHLYLYALLGGQPGLGFSRYTLDLMAALESIATLPLMFWLGCEVMGRERRRYALGFALLATALLAVSHWHVVLGRQGLRIAVSPLITTLSAIFFVRGLRHNRRADFVLAGLTLALGLYSYKSLRMLPVVYVLCVGIALLLKRYPWRVRMKYLLNLATLAFVACMVFVPMFHFWLEYPDDFTGRMTTRIFGYEANTTEERLDALGESGATLLGNLRNSFLMFHFTSDSTWVSAAPGEPAMDTVTAALFLLGIAAWLSRMASSRDPVNWFVSCLLVFMLIIPALAIAFPIEVPHNQRSSPGMPAAYLIAALPLALFCRLAWRILPRRVGMGATVLLCGALLFSSYQYNHRLYFGPFMQIYHRSAQSHAHGGRILRGFVESDGAFGNAYLVSIAHWWDVRAVGIEAGIIHWYNTAHLHEMPGMMRDRYQRGGDHPLMPDRDLLFFYAWHDEAALPQLRAWFPQGRATYIETPWVDQSFYIFRVPALGEQGLQDFLNQYG